MVCPLFCYGRVSIEAISSNQSTIWSYGKIDPELGLDRSPKLPSHIPSLNRESSATCLWFSIPCRNVWNGWHHYWIASHSISLSGSWVQNQAIPILFDMNVQGWVGYWFAWTRDSATHGWRTLETESILNDLPVASPAYHECVLIFVGRYDDAACIERFGLRLSLGCIQTWMLPNIANRTCVTTNSLYGYEYSGFVYIL